MLAICRLPQCQCLFVAGHGQLYCCGQHARAAERLQRCGDPFGQYELLQCDRPDCQNFFIRHTYNHRFCIQTHGEVMDYRMKQKRATKRRYKREPRGRVCKWCGRDDEMTHWSNGPKECAACARQRERGSTCSKCGGPFYVQLTVRRDRMTGCPHCSRLTVYERLELGWDL